MNSGVPSRQQKNENHAPNGEQSVPDGVGYGVAECGYLTVRAITHQTERSSGSAGSGENAQQNCIVESENVLADIQAEDERQSGSNRSPKKETNSLRAKPVDESWARGDTDNGDEDIQTDRVHEPNGRRRNAAK